MASDIFKTVKGVSQAEFTEQRSKFIGFAIPVKTAEEALAIVDEYRNEYHNSRHVCWAYMLGNDREEFRSNDDGEPSGTAGRPILGQINSNELTDILIVVIRYFGGIKLGTGGLIVAYREAAALAIAEAKIIELTVDKQISFKFEYPFMNDVMRAVKELEADMLEQEYDHMSCVMTLSIREGLFGELKQRLKNIETLEFDDQEEIDDENREDE